MMRIRTIKPEFFLHERLFEAEQQSGLPLRVAYAGLWCAADREGRFKWEPRRLGVQILPYDQVDFSRVLDALTTRGFIVKYASGTGEFGVIPSFTTHQVINNRERESELPDPAGGLENTGFDACRTRGSREPDGNAESESGREGNKEQGTRKGKELLLEVQEQPKPDRFNEFWSLYPRKVGKTKAREKWETVKPELVDTILAAVAEQAKSWDWIKNDGQFIPHPATWLHQQRWEDELKPAVRSDVTNRQHDELPAFLEDDNAIFHPKAA